MMVSDHASTSSTDCITKVYINFRKQQMDIVLIGILKINKNPKDQKATAFEIFIRFGKVSSARPSGPNRPLSNRLGNNSCMRLCSREKSEMEKK